MARVLEKLDKLLLLVGLVVLSGALTPLLAGTYDYHEERDGLLLRIIWTTIYAFALSLLMLRRGWPVHAAKATPAVLGVVAICLASSLWSPAPLVTLSRVVNLVGTTLLGVYLGMRFSMRELTGYLYVVATILVGLSLAVCLAGLPFSRFPGWEEKVIWQGVFGHKNGLGLISSLSLLTLLMRGLRRERVGLAALVLAGIACFTLYKSSSFTPALSLLLAAGVGGALFVSTRLGLTRAAAASVIALVVGGCAAIALGAKDALLVAADKSADGSGRGDIWQVALQLVGEHPALGVGYGTLGDTAGFKQLSELHHHVIAHCHNGYLELAASVGLPASLLGAYALADFMRLGLRGTRAGVDLAALVFATYVAAYNMFEIGLYSQQRLLYVFFLALYVQLRWRAAAVGASAQRGAMRVSSVLPLRGSAVGSLRRAQLP